MTVVGSTSGTVVVFVFASLIFSLFGWLSVVSLVVVAVVAVVLVVGVEVCVVAQYFCGANLWLWLWLWGWESAGDGVDRCGLVVVSVVDETKREYSERGTVSFRR